MTTTQRGVTHNGEAPAGESEAPARERAARLLGLQVQFVIAEMTGDRLAEVIARDTHDVLAICDRIAVAEAVPPETVKALARRYVETVGGSPVVESLAIGIADAVYELAAADEYELSAVIAREHAETLVAKILSMRETRDLVLDRLTTSPVVATVASWFVNKIVTDFLQANAERAERIPGVGSLLGAGRRAAGVVRGQTELRLGDVLGDIAGHGAQFATRRLVHAIRETMDEAPLHDAVMEVWDYQAGQSMSSLREYLSARDLREIVAIIHGIWLHLRGTDYFLAALDAGIDAVFDGYGQHTVGELLAELGLDEAGIVADVSLLVPPAIDAVKGTGLLEEFVSRRLAPFWMSPEVLALIG
jgi:hypothetical protein